MLLPFNADENKNPGLTLEIEETESRFKHSVYAGDKVTGIVRVKKYVSRMKRRLDRRESESVGCGEDLTRRVFFCIPWILLLHPEKVCHFFPSHVIRQS